MSFISGILLGFSLIIAIGAQNIWVLSQSMAGANRFAVAGVCILCDVTLIMIGVIGAKEINEALPAFIPFLKWGGILFLGYLALQAFRRAMKGTSGLVVGNSHVMDWRKTAITAFGISLLNPHVYLDTVVLLGNIGALQPHPMIFAMGACIASIFWFSSLSYFAPVLKSILNSPSRWRVFDFCIGAVLTGIAIKLYFIA